MATENLGIKPKQPRRHASGHVAATGQKRILIQAGHVNIQYNSIASLRGSTGAPGEQAFTKKCRDLVSDELRKRGFFVQGTDANANDDPAVTNVDWDLVLAVHYEADVHNTNGGIMCAPAADADAVNKESVRIRDAMLSKYFSTVAIPAHQEWQNPNTYYYYLWNSMSANTPCVLIECGVGNRVPEDRGLVNDRINKVVEGIVRGVCLAFNVSYDITPPAPVVDWEKKYNDSQAQVQKLQKKLDDIVAVAKS